MAINFSIPFPIQVLPGGGAVTSQVAQGIQPPDVSKLFDSYFAGQDVARKQQLQDLFANADLKNISYGDLADRLLRAGGPEQLQNFLGLKNLEGASNLPQIRPFTPRTEVDPNDRPPSAARPPAQATSRYAPEPDEITGDTLQPRQKGNTTGDPTEVPGRTTVQYDNEPPQALNLSAEPQQPDSRYPGKFANVPVTGPPTPTGRFTPEPPVQVAQAQEPPPARSRAPAATPVQSRGYNESIARQWDERATEMENNALAADRYGQKAMGDTYRAEAARAKDIAAAARAKLIEGQFEQTKTQIEQDKGVITENRKTYLAAKNQGFLLDQIDDDIKTLGSDRMGSGANIRSGLARTYQTVRNLMPEAVEKELPAVDINKIASWESFNKASQKLGFELAKTLGSREAQMIVKQATQSVPNADQSYWGALLVSSGMRQAAQREMDLYRFLLQAQRDGRSVAQAEVEFNDTNPVAKYVRAAARVVPPQAAINDVTANPTPQLRAQFKRKYGDAAYIGVFGTGAQ